MKDVGQLIITGISGYSLLDEERDFIEKNNIGGVILFSHNFDSPAQLAELVNSIQVLRQEYPLFISVDHEGGRVHRFKKYFTHFPSMGDIAKLDSPKICFSVYKIMAEELRACGVNLNFAPCCDILVNPSNKVIGDRSFGGDEDTVSKFISAAIRGMNTNDLLTCAKHFPGHGSTSKDSHQELPFVKTTIEDLNANEFQPFIKAVKARVDFVMMGHLVVDSIDQDNPCSLSGAAYKILRDDLKFNRIIVTDDMQMGAIINHHGVEDSAVKAISAGADMLIYRDMENARKALAAINEAIKKKQILNTNIEEKLNRIRDCKAKYFKDFKPIYIPKISNKINTAGSQVFLKEIEKMIAEKNSQK